MPAVRRLSVSAVLALVASAAVPGAVSAAAPADTVTVTSCTEAAFRAAVAAVPDGGTVAFGCDGTIPITAAAGGRVELPTSMTIDGTGHTVTLDGGGETGLLANVGFALTLRGLTLARGAANAPDLQSGGAVFNTGTLLADRVVFRGNTAQLAGGALALAAGAATIVNSRFEANAVDCAFRAALSIGGAVWSGTSNALDVSGTSFVDNQARCSGGAEGAALFLSDRAIATRYTFPSAPLLMGDPGPRPGAAVTVTDSTFTHNVAAMNSGDDTFNLSGGGAVTAFNRPLRVSGSTFERNAVAGPGQANGGAIFSAAYRDTTLDVSDSVFRDNTYQDSTVVGAPAGPLVTRMLRGGAIATARVTATVSSSTFSGNSAMSGGALFVLSGHVDLVRSALHDNHGGLGRPNPPAPGGALTVFGVSQPVIAPGSVTVTDSALADNDPVTCSLFDPAAVTLAGTTADSAPGTCVAPSRPTAVPSGALALALPSGPVAPGASVPVTVSGLAPGALLRIAAIPTSAAGPAVDLALVGAGPAAADLSGSCAGDVTGPSTPGVYRVVILGEAAGYAGLRAFTGVLVVAAPGQAVAPVVTAAPVATTVAAGRAATFTATAAGSPAPSVQWQRSTDGVTWTDLPGATGATLTTPVLGLDDPGSSFRAVFSSTAGSVTSTPARLTVTPVPVAVTSTGRPVAAGDQVAPGAALQLALRGLPAGAVTVTAGGGPVLGSGTAGADGTATVTAVAPAVTGAAELVVRAAGVVVARFPLVVTAAVASAPSPSTSAGGSTSAAASTSSPAAAGRGVALATTGSDVAAAAALGLAVLAAGGALVAVGRRRRTGVGAGA